MPIKVRYVIAATGLILAVNTPVCAHAEDALKIGLIAPMTGIAASTGRQIDNAVRLYMRQHGDTVAGRKIEIILRDDAAIAENTRRVAQELIVNDKVDILAGFGLTPGTLATAPLATQAKIPMVVMAAGTSIITDKSSYIVRTSFTLPQSASVIGAWASRNGIKTATAMISDYAPGVDALTFFKKGFEAGGGRMIEEVRVPMSNPDFAPFLQRMKDAKPDAIFVFVPAGQGGAFMKQYVERGLNSSGIKVIGTGDIMDDDLLADMGDATLGMVTAHIYSAAHPSAKNEEFVAAYRQAFKARPGFMAVGAYDGMHLIYEALKKTGGASGAALVTAMKGMAWESPRGPVAIDPDTRDIVQNVYVRKVEKVNGEPYNVEFDVVQAVKDPGKNKD
ncbi:ABC transporter substrate-binding protein [Tardiphaga robiniae]|uniref:ABC transporter substrate-binding protein n=1 Tax=Tardiphaga robiniae TaxID=943830 RepID=UPI0015866C73|nr:ABC transporter substrate-binding protein [Tardiphaga robiniae]NUU42613.1 ABC transporter substrate-binding protein [Tardiphaga robiniae]